MITSKQFIQYSAFTLSLGLLYLLIAANVQAEITQVDFNCNAVSEIPKLECEALVTLYDRTGGPNWDNNMDWLVTTTPCSWSGVTCEGGHVSLLTLDENGLVGNIPKIGNLTKLTTLSFRDNQLRAVPGQIGNLASLTVLRLNSNQLIALPEQIGKLTNLTALYLSDNQLTTLPSGITNLTSLTTLALGNNRLSIADGALLGWMNANDPDWVNNQNIPGPFENCVTVSEIPQLECEALVALYENTNGPNWYDKTEWLATDTPCSWYGVRCRAGHVTELLLWSNGLVGDIPAEIGDLTGLTTLNLRYNQLSTLPIEIGNLINLTTLYLRDNQLRTLPGEIGNLASLTVLGLRDNQLVRFPAEISSLTNLATLGLRGNQLGTLPIEIGNLTSLTSLYLRGNRLSILPTQIGDLTNLATLGIRDNQLTTLPASIGNLTNLVTLGLRSNQLNTLPAEISNLSRLSTLELEGNSLRSLPVEIGNLTNLTVLRLHGNQLSSLPAEMGNLVSLAVLDLYNNRLETLPSDIVNLTNLTEVDLGRNRLSITDETLRAWMDERDSDWDEMQSLEVPTRIPMPTLTPTPMLIDGYESNDNCAQSATISTDGARQEHTFHAAGDTDWVQFNITAGTEYRIEVMVPDNSRADVVPEFYAECDTQSVDKVWGGTFGPGTRLIFSADEDSTAYLRFANLDDSVYGGDVAYGLSVQTMSAEPQNRAVIIVAGRLERDDGLQDNIHNVTEQVYRLFQQKGYSNDDIYYLATDSELTGYDASASLENLRFAITEWAADRLGDAGVLTLYMMDHGDPDKLYIDDLNGQILTPDDLDEWLTAVETDKQDIKVNVILEACHIGSFIEGSARISKPGRVIITSSNVEWDAYASDTGAYFSDHFLTSLRQGRDLSESFSQATNYVHQFFSFQQPWLDANGNGIHNEPEDGLIASQRSFAYAGTLSGGSNNDSWPPYIAQVTGSVNLDSNRGTIRAEVRDDGRLDDVWAVIYPPSHVFQEGGTGELIQEVLQKPKLQATGNDQYAVETAFSERGMYRIAIYAEDNEGLLARPKMLMLFVGYQLYLPTISR